MPDEPLVQSVLQIKVINALRSTHGPQQLAELAKTYNVADYPGLLGLATQIAPSPTVEWVADMYVKRGRNLNEQDDSGNTALHYAVASSRRDCTRLLLECPSIDDTVSNSKGLMPSDMAHEPEMVELISHAQEEFTTRTALVLKDAFRKRDLKTLEKVYENPRVGNLVNLDGLDPDTGEGVLHDAAASGDAHIVQFILAHGADPLLRDSSDRVPSDLARDENTRRILNNAAKSRAILDQTQFQTAGAAPEMNGYLKKWVNFTQGYKVRYFVLRNDTLTYYKSAKEPERKMRGTIHLRYAVVRMDSSEKNKFEVRTANDKFHLKAMHPAETNKWVWALQSSITHARDADRRSRKSTTSQRSVSGVLGSPVSKAASTGSGHSRKPSVNSQVDTTGLGIIVNDLEVRDDDDSTSSGEDESLNEELDELENGELPRLSSKTLITRLGALKDLINLLLGKVEEQELQDALVTALKSIDTLSADAQRYGKVYRAQLKRSDRAEKEWAKNYRDLEVSYEKLEGQLYALKRDNQDSEDEFYDVAESSPAETPTVAEARDESSQTTEDTSEAAKESVAGGSAGDASSGDAAGGPAAAAAAGAGGATAAAGGAAVAGGTSTNPQTDEGKEDANSGENEGAVQTPEKSSGDSNTMVPRNLTPTTEKQSAVVEIIKKENSFAGYEDPPRKKLAIDNDNRPRLSLWSILKNLIGKDMTRMTLPVTFNECTSLLQRSAEDMEYVDLLDLAAQTPDEGLRMAYIVAFAASSYSSTINRVAKPFNPLLGETYEYARPDQGFRMMAEQVSHHPPIGALYARSRHWDFYGESHVESHFYGRSFDINPLGLWYLHMRPDKGDGPEEEVYSFRKVTSSVVGIMLGNPVVDNYGPMTIENHTTGVVANVDFKARGWRGSSAYKLEGDVKSAKGEVLYHIVGRWNDRIFAINAKTKKKTELWRVHERGPAPFNLTPFAITLNALPDKLRPWLAPTDTRLRPDQRAMEEGRYDDASKEKARVEDKQRAVRRKREETGQEYKPQWFTLQKHPVTGKQYYQPINDYWGQRANHNLADKGDIF